MAAPLCSARPAASSISVKPAAGKTTAVLHLVVHQERQALGVVRDAPDRLVEVVAVAEEGVVAPVEQADALAGFGGAVVGVLPG